MGYYQTKAKQNTQANRKDPRYKEMFDSLRDNEFSVSESRLVASEAVGLLDKHPDWTTEQAIKEVLK